MGQASFSNEQPGRVRGIERWEIRDRAHSARQSIVTAAHACMAGLAAGALPDDAFARDRYSVHEPCREMRRFVSEYAHILSALGHEPPSATELVLHAVREAAGHQEPPDAMLAAVRDWTLDSFQVRPLVR